MKNVSLFLILISALSYCANASNQSRREAEYYVTVYAEHYHVPVEFVRAVVEQESGWQRCPVSRKGAAGLMQLMPDTARRLNVQNRCNLSQNVSGGVRYLAALMNRFNGDLRLVAAAYYAGERAIERKRLKYSNPDVVTYVMSIRERFEHKRRFRSLSFRGIPGRTR